MRPLTRPYLIGQPRRVLQAVADFLGVRTAPANSFKEIQQKLVHIFVFESEEVARRHPEHIASIVRSLLPEAMAYGDVPVSHFIDPSMPAAIGTRKLADIERISKYRFAWEKIRDVNPEYVSGLKVGRERFTFSWEEYEREGHLRGVLLAFYELSARTKPAGSKLFIK